MLLQNYSRGASKIETQSFLENVGLSYFLPGNDYTYVAERLRYEQRNCEVVVAYNKESVSFLKESTTVYEPCIHFEIIASAYLLDDSTKLICWFIERSIYFESSDSPGIRLSGLPKFAKDYDSLSYDQERSVTLEWRDFKCAMNIDYLFDVIDVYKVESRARAEEIQLGSYSIYYDILQSLNLRWNEYERDFYNHLKQLFQSNSIA